MLTMCFEFLPIDSLYSPFKNIVWYLNIFLCQACKIVEGQRYTKRLNEKQITALLKVTCQRPRDRENDILQVDFWCYGPDWLLQFLFPLGVREKLTEFVLSIADAYFILVPSRRI